MKLIGFFCVLLIAVVCAREDQVLSQWKINSSANITSTGDAISQIGYDDSAWYAADNVPGNGTAMAVLIEDGLYPDIYFGVNYEFVSTAQFDVSWWYRAEMAFDTTNYTQGENVLITFKGINYKANVWFNGVQIGTKDDIVGTFRYFDFNVTSLVQAQNAIALEIFRPYDNMTAGLDLAITFVDWNPYPMDANMGLWQEVVVKVGGPVTVRYPLVDTQLSNGLGTAHLTLMAEVQNFANTEVTGVLSARIPELQCECILKVQLDPLATSQVFITNSTCPCLDVQNPDLWWPAQMGKPTLHTLHMNFTLADGTVTDSLRKQFGIRQMTSELNHGYRLYQVNGKNILIRGGGYSPDMFLRTTPEHQLLEILYTLDMGLNAIRLEGKFENDHFFDLGDQYGILMLPGICCCDAWQKWDQWGPTQYNISQASLRSQVKRLRIHASMLVFLYSSDQLPPESVEKLYLNVLETEYWPNPVLSSAAAWKSKITGPSGVKMSGPYSWVSPNYWLVDKQNGGAFGFLTEGGPGEAPMTYDSWAWTVPDVDLWPMDDVYWPGHNGGHCSNCNFGSLDRFTNPLNARYGNSSSSKEYLLKSQLSIYEGHRAMFEGYSRNKYTSTGVIQWMLNNAYPENIWHLFDYYMNQGGSYFGSKKACEPVHLIYGYDDNNVWIVNSMYETVTNMNATAEIFNLDGELLYNFTLVEGTIGPDSTTMLFALPATSQLALTSTYFIRLSLYNASEPLSSGFISDNLYWLSTSLDVLDEANSTWFDTPCSSYADYTLLQTMPRVDLNVTSSFHTGKDMTDVMVTVHNPTDDVAFFVRVRLVTDADQQTVLPIFWSDNYITLFAGETRKLVGSVYSSSIANQQVSVITESWNNDRGN